jgi:hypothetical protein
MIRSIAMSRATLMSLPTTGTQWNRLVTMANNSYSFSPLENAPQASGNVLAGALVGVRTNNTTLLNRVNQALDRFQSYATSAWQHAAFNRKAVGFVQAGEVVGRDTTAWRNALMAHLTGRHSGGGGGSDYHEILENGALRLSNNHGRAAFQTYAAIIAALNLTDRVQDACASAKAWLGGTHSENGGWAMQATNRPTGRVMGWEGNDPAAASWYVSGRISGINPDDPLGSDRRAGAVPGDVHRDGGNFPNPGAAVWSTTCGAPCSGRPQAWCLCTAWGAPACSATPTTRSCGPVSGWTGTRRIRPTSTPTGTRCWSTSTGVSSAAPGARSRRWARA